MIYDYIIVGGGVIGMATGFKLQERFPEAKILIVEKEKALSSHQTGRNSGVIHSGIYYKSNSKKATNCFDGRLQLEKFATENQVKWERCGKIIVATQESELPVLDTIMERGKENNLEGLRFIDQKEIRELEPFCSGIKGIFVPQTGIIDYVGLVQTFEKKILSIQPQSKIHKGLKVVDIETIDGNKKKIKAGTTEFIGNKLIVCAGLQADRMAKMDGLNPHVRIVPFRGDYYDLTEDASHKVKNLIYPVPNPEFPFLGVHFTRMVKGGVECGPNAVFSFAREGYSKTSFSLIDSISSLGFIGTWKLFSKHWKHGLGEYKRAYSKIAFLNALKELIPTLTIDEIKPARAGIRAQALDANGKLVDDFYFEKGTNSVHVINAPSPAATACLAIADEIIDQL